MKKTGPLLALFGLLMHAVTASDISTGAVSMSICPGSSVTVPFTFTGVFNDDNIFAVQLSDGTGSFFNPLTIGTFAGSQADSIVAIIPADVVTGTGYRIRVVSSDPPVAGVDNGVYLTIQTNPRSPLLTSTGPCLGSGLISVSGGMGISSLQFYSNDALINSISDSVYFGSTVAGGNGFGDNYNQLALPYGVFADRQGNVYVADASNNRILRFPLGSDSSTNGEIVAGGNGPGAAANQLDAPYFVYVTDSGYIYVSDTYNNRVQKFPPGSDSATMGVTVAGGNGIGGADNQISSPRGIFVDPRGNLYVVDKGNNRVMKFPPGSTSATYGAIVAGGYISGYGANQLYNPKGLWLDGAGNIYVADYSNSRIQEFPAGSDSTTMAITVAGGNGAGDDANQFMEPYGVYVDATGNIFVADPYNNRVQKFPPGSTSASSGITVVGTSGFGDDLNQVFEPTEISMDGNGNLYVADYGNNRIQKFSLYIADTSFVPATAGTYSASYTNAFGCTSALSSSATIFHPLFQVLIKPFATAIVIWAEAGPEFTLIPLPALWAATVFVP